MITAVFTVFNKRAGHARFKQGDLYYYPIDPALTEALAQTAFENDSARESKVVTPKPETIGKIWQQRAGTIIDDGSNKWIARGEAPAGQNGALFVYFDALPGQKLVHRLTNSAGVVSEKPLVEDPNGYPRQGLINPNRPGGLPKYAVLLVDIANGDYTSQVFTTAGVPRSKADKFSATQTGPNSALSSPAPATDSGTTPTDSGSSSSRTTIAEFAASSRTYTNPSLHYVNDEPWFCDIRPGAVVDGRYSLTDAAQVQTNAGEMVRYQFNDYKEDSVAFLAGLTFPVGVPMKIVKVIIATDQLSYYWQANAIKLKMQRIIFIPA